MDTHTLEEQPKFQDLWSLSSNDYQRSSAFSVIDGQAIARQLLSEQTNQRSYCSTTASHDASCNSNETHTSYEAASARANLEHSNFSLSDVASDDGSAQGDSPCPGSSPRKGCRMVANCDEVTIFPRKKAGQDKLGSNRPPIIITRAVLEKYFDMPQQLVCKKMGICATVIKKVCRQLGIDKWPYKGNKIDLRKRGLGPAGRKESVDDMSQTSPSTAVTSPSIEKLHTPLHTTAAPEVGESRSVKIESFSTDIYVAGASKPPVVTHKPSPTTEIQPRAKGVRGTFSPRNSPGSAFSVVVGHSSGSELASAQSDASTCRPESSMTVAENVPAGVAVIVRSPSAAAAHQVSAGGSAPASAAGGMEDVEPREMSEGCDLGWLVAPEPKAFGQLQEQEDILSPFYRGGQHQGWE
eukprot:CAMPEP_0181310438 /NCGR_PEP_ID=MMETSP1101-20121128/12586_1 /TAXON_ID=46948 /ORGANISM="Rhodomonas abbreviata, Strain Caron Lab Isolate" /LENGTH=409 /DNA_ID=CAMNT_0023417067 /DNA_START=35 /DNA_END=1264 /DNA_ORIENTATION=-